MATRVFEKHPDPSWRINDEALIVAIAGGLAFRLWRWWSFRYEPSFDRYINRPRRVWLFVRLWRPQVWFYFV